MSFMWNPMVTQYLRNVCYCWSCSFFGFYSIVLGWFSSQSYSLRLLTQKRIQDHLSPVGFGHHGTHTSHPCSGGEVVPSYCINLLLLCIQSALPYTFQVFIRYPSLPSLNNSGRMPSSLSGTIAYPFTRVCTHLYSPTAREGNTHSMTTLIK